MKFFQNILQGKNFSDNYFIEEKEAMHDGQEKS